MFDCVRDETSRVVSSLVFRSGKKKKVRDSLIKTKLDFLFLISLLSRRVWMWYLLPFVFELFLFPPRSRWYRIWFLKFQKFSSWFSIKIVGGKIFRGNQAIPSNSTKYLTESLFWFYIFNLKTRGIESETIASWWWSEKTRQFNVEASEINDVKSDTFVQIPLEHNSWAEGKSHFSCSSPPSSLNNLILNYNKTEAKISFL